MRFKLRAECAHDIALLQQALGARATAWRVVRAEDVPDVRVEFESDMALEAIERTASAIEDGHVMAETVAEASRYTGIRAYGKDGTAS
jgi:hypothetical protein